MFLINLKGGSGVVALKQGSSSSAGEYFCSLLLAELGVATPAMRCAGDAPEGAAAPHAGVHRPLAKDELTAMIAERVAAARPGCIAPRRPLTL